MLRLILALLLLSGCSGDPIAAEPHLVFADGFENDLEQAQLVAAGGTRVSGYDAWLKLLPLTRLRPRHESDYRYRDCAEPVAWFNRETRQRELHLDQGGLVCREYTNPKFNYENGRWLIEDRYTGHVYFRVWKSF